MQSSACNWISQRFNEELNVWELKFSTKCGPRVAVGKDFDATVQLAEREASQPQRPTLVVLS